MAGRVCRVLSSLLQRATHIPCPSDASDLESEATQRQKLVSGGFSSSDDTPEGPDELAADAGGAVVPCLLALLIGLTPLVVVFPTFVLERSTWGSVAAVESVWVVLPALVCWVWPDTRARFLAALRRSLTRTPMWRVQLPVGLLLGLGSFFSAAAMFEALEWARVPWWDEVTRRIVREGVVYGFSRHDAAGATTFCIYFTVVNPVLEEVFWRIFLREALSHRAVTHFLPPNPAPRAVETWAHGWRGTLALWLCTSALYASYHGNVLFVFLSPCWASVGLVGLVLFGVFLQALVQRVGLLAAVLAHVGGDAVVVLGLTDAIFDYLRR